MSRKRTARDGAAAAARITVEGPIHGRYADLLCPPCLMFVGELARRFTGQVDALLERRRRHQAGYDRGKLPRFLPETASLRADDWTVAPIPADLQDRRVEITGPVDREMIINALNSGANVFVADFEDATAPTWDNLVGGQVNLRDVVDGSIEYLCPRGRRYELNKRTATLMVRLRGWHLWEKHVRLDGRAVPAGLFDFAVFLYHNTARLIDRGSGPYFSLPKLQSHLEARLWNDVFNHAQDCLGLPRGTIRATVLIETLPAAFEMDEIIYELRDHSAGLSCGRRDYLFSFIKTRRANAACVLPDRAQVTMEQPFMQACTQLLVRTCHRRGIHALGGRAAQIPIKGDPEAGAAAMEMVRAEKLREVTDGHDGTRVAHPDLVPVARAVFDEHMDGPNQLHRTRDDVTVTEADLLAVPTGTRTEAGLRQNARLGVQYLAAWLCGRGCVPLIHLMADAATAEICRAQLWQWIHHRAELDDGRPITAALFHRLLAEETSRMRDGLGTARFESGRYQEARELFGRLATTKPCADFLTLGAYERLADAGGSVAA